MEQRISVVTLGVRNLAASQAFYESLGWRCSTRATDEVVFFQLGGIVLSLLPREVLAREADVEPQGSGFCGVAFAYNTRSKAEVEAVMARAQRAGACIRKAIQTSVWGDYGGYFSDLDGYLWQVAWNPGLDPAVDGSVTLFE
jgi:predicted lactoylglutathione lyase